MESFSSKLKSTGFKNWIKLCLSLSIVTEGLEEYTTRIITHLHRQIYQVCAISPNCEVNCFKNIRWKNKWCSSCTLWKNQIMKYCRFKGFTNKIQWELYDSKSLSESPEKLVKVFIPDWDDNNRHYSFDISLVMSLFFNCNAFDIHTDVIAAVRKVRNKYFAHNQSIEITDSQFEICINRLVSFLQSKDIKETNSGSMALQKIKDLRSKDVIDEITEKGENFRIVSETYLIHYEFLVKSLRDSQNKFQEEILTFLHNSEVKRKKTISMSPWFIFIFAIVFLVVVLVIYAVFPSFWTKAPKQNLIGNHHCEDMSYDYPWPNEIKFEGYIRDHADFIGRDWLVDELSEKLEDSDKGIYLTAVMGYGKSALFSRLLCSTEQSPGWNIRKKLLSFHICKFDVITTQKPDLFIRNIAGKIAKFIPEYGNIILDDETIMRYLKGERCSEDPFGCLDIGVIDPLNRLTNVPNKFIIAIDALDECVSMIENKTPTIPDILSSRISRFPSWVKFLLTSRNISLIQDNFRMLNQVDLDPLDSRNLRDLQEFINAYIERVKNVDKYSAYDDNVKTAAKSLQKLSKGNFLYIKHALIAWSKSGNPSLDNLPSTLEDIYKRNFERVFGKNEEHFGDARIVFEILCASIVPLMSSEVLAIAKLKSPYIERSIIKLLRNEMGHFLSTRDDYIQIAHKTIKEWLTKADRKHSTFYICNENGNKLFAEYMFRQVKKNATESNLFALAAYVADSKDRDLENQFNHYFKTFHVSKTNISNDLLHKAAAFLNHYRGFKILYETTNIDIESRNSEGVTAIFIAASHGHHMTVKSLLDLGANVTFRIEKPILHFHANDPIHYGKIVALWGYNSLHIATQNNHYETTRLLIEMNEMLMYENNSFGLNPFQLAAELGNTEIMLLFLNKNTSFADDHSLYYASQNGHHKAVRLILKSHVNDKCLRCDGSLYWLRSDALRIQSNFLGYQNIRIINSSHFYISEQQTKKDFIDDWRLLSCDTALHAAIRNCHFRVVKSLVKKLPSTLKCTNFQGYSPLLFSIIYNCLDIFKFLVEQGSDLSQNCTSNKSILKSQLYQLNAKETDFVMERPCLKSPNLVHLIAKFDRFEFALYLIKIRAKSENEKMKVNWALRDDDNCTTLHYAACYSSIQMIFYLINFGIHVDTQSSNGSTPFHSAVTCNSIVSLMSLKEVSKRNPLFISSLIDNDKRDILTYLFLPKLKDQPIDENTESIRKQMLLTIIDNMYGGHYNFNKFDIHGQTALSYAIHNGHFECIKFLYYNKLKHLLRDWTDLNNKTVLDLAFDAIKALPVNKAELGYRVETNIHASSFSPYDLTVIFFLKHFEKGLQNMKSKISSYEYIAAEYGRYYLLPSLSRFSHKNNTIPLISILLHSKGSVLLQPLELNGNIHISVFNCSKEAKAFPLHRIVMNKSNKYWFYSPYHSMLLSNILNEYSPDMLDFCIDNAGYNLLQRAALGGHRAAIEFLIGKGMDINKRFLSKINLMELTIANAPFKNNKESIDMNIQLSGTPGSYTKDYYNAGKLVRREIIINNSSETINFDQSSVYLFKKLSVTCQVICKKNIRELSLIHIAAAKGLITFVKSVKESCGSQILSCETIDRITPFYLAKLFSQSEIVQYLNNRSSFVLPKKMAESVLIMKIFFLFNNPIPANSSIWKCLSIKNIFPVWRTLFKKQNCILTVLLEKDLYPDHVIDNLKLNMNYSTFRYGSFKLYNKSKTEFLKCLFIPHFYYLFKRSALRLFDWTNIERYSYIHSIFHHFCHLHINKKSICQSQWESCEIIVQGSINLADRTVSFLYQQLKQVTKTIISLKYRLFAKRVATINFFCQLAQQETQRKTDPKISSPISFECKRLMKLAPLIFGNCEELFNLYMRADYFDVLKRHDT